MSSPVSAPNTAHIQGPSRGATACIAIAAMLGAVAIAFLGLLDFSFTDYEVEAYPAISKLLDGDLSGYAAALPGYGGAVVLLSPFALVGNLVGPDHDLWAWRLQALPGVALLAGLGIVLGRRVAASVSGRAGTAWGVLTALLIGGAPFAMLAMETGHSEELLVAGLSVVGILLASRGNVVTGAVAVGLAASAKPWAVIAVPVVLLAAADRRTLIRAALACAVAGALLMVPAAVSGGATQVTQSTHSSTTGIFKPDNVFWFAGRSNPEWQTIQDARTVRAAETNAEKAGWAQRLEPAWAAKASHPAIVAFAVLLAAAFWRLRPRLAGREDLLLLLSAACWWRCLLDTWNVHYYALGALLALVAWEASRGRPPVASAIVTTLAWTTFQIFPASEITPDVHTALYLAWALPVGVAMVGRALAPELCRGLAARALGPLAAQLPTLARFASGVPASPGSAPPR